MKAASPAKTIARTIPTIPIVSHVPLVTVMVVVVVWVVGTVIVESEVTVVPGRVVVTVVVTVET
jgi:hypothetical protein